MFDMIADRIWDILVVYVGASERQREDFASWFLENTGPEYRFIGSLGFGGKFWNNANKWYINCYAEDETVERKESIKMVNKLLFELKEKHLIR